MRHLILYEDAWNAMFYKVQSFTNFSHAVKSRATAFRPDDEWQIKTVFAKNHKEKVLARGNGLSYSDCCMLNDGIMIDTSRLNHLLSFDSTTGIAVCQGAATFADLFLFDPQFIPPVIPGTLKATLAGGLANDVHGKNNHLAGTLGHHIVWFDLEVNQQTYECSQNKNTELFFATLGGIGLTGVIKRIGIRLRKAGSLVKQQNEQHYDMNSLLKRMQTEGITHDYQVAWLDWLNEPRAILSFADHSELNSTTPPLFYEKHRIPKLPGRLLNPWLMKQFNRFYFHKQNDDIKLRPLSQFNNPLDNVAHWNRLYGKKGLLQFQAVFSSQGAETILQTIYQKINSLKAAPTLVVLKYFTKESPGLLSFGQPGFTLAVDFINNAQARAAILALNEFMTEVGGKVYLAKDLFLTRTQFDLMYPNHSLFCELIKKYKSPMSSNLGQRLGLST